MGKLNSIIILLVGKSGSGKTTLAEKLKEKYCYQILSSYTTRPKRYENETGHIFIDDSTYEALQDKVATTYFNGYHYCSTKDQIDMSDVYIIDPDGVETLKQNYTGTKELIPIYIDLSMEDCLNRMRRRGDDEESCWSRLKNDEKAFKGFKEKSDYTIDGKESVDILAVTVNIIATLREHLTYKHQFTVVK